MIAPISIQTLSALESHLPSANSLYEYAAWNIWDGVSRFGRATDQARLSQILNGTHSLNDLCDFVESAGLGSRFELPQGDGEVIDRLANNAGHFLCEGAAYLLGGDFIRQVFEEALANFAIAADVRELLERIPRERFSLLKMNRLFHVLLDASNEYKANELIRFPWNARTSSRVDSFVAHPEVRRAVQAVEEEISRTPQSAFDDRRSLSKDVEAQQGDLFLSDLKEDLMKRFRGLQILLKNQDEMIRLQEGVDEEGISRRHPTTPTKRIIADYLLPRENGGRPAIVLLWPVVSRLDVKVRVLHESTHLKQALRFGEDWPQKNILVAEMWAYAVEVLHYLRHGDLSLYHDIMRYSRFGFGLALRNFVEHFYVRQASPLSQSTLQTP